MNTSFSTAFTTASTTTTSSVIRVRLMPLKKLVTTQTATATGPPSRRGSQYARASASISGARPKGLSSHAPLSASTAKNGAVNSEPHNPLHTARAAR